jgi:deazaflavin-dependent oxidoreductase (nitroreductase family)
MPTAHHPPLFVRLASPLMTTLLAQGIAVRPLALLTVRGRSSGRLHTTPVAVLERGGQRWVAAMFGEVGWTHNLRAAGQAILTRGRSRTPVGVQELTPEAAGQVIKDAVAPDAASRLAAWVLRRYLRVTPDSSLNELVAAAQRHPVFQLRESSRVANCAAPPMAGEKYECQVHPGLSRLSNRSDATAQDRTPC